MNSLEPLRKPRADDPAFVRAVADALRRYRDGENPQHKKLNQRELSALFKVSPANISNLLREWGEGDIKAPKSLSAQLLARALKAGAFVTYEGVDLVARSHDTSSSNGHFPTESDLSQQISFLFEKGCTLEDEPDGLSVTVERKRPASSAMRVRVQIKVVR